MNREEKQQRIDHYDQIVKEATYTILSEHGEMSVPAVEELRSELAEVGCAAVVIKNTLAKIVFERNGHEEICEYLIGPSMLAYGTEEIAPAAKILQKKMRKNKGLVIKGIVFDGAVYPAEDFKTFTAMPTKSEVRAKLLSIWMAPATGLVRIISPASRLLTVFQQYSEKKEN